MLQYLLLGTEFDPRRFEVSTHTGIHHIVCENMGTTSSTDGAAPQAADEEAATGDMKPMPVSSSADDDDAGGSNWLFKADMTKKVVLPRRYKLVTDESYRKYSILTLQFAILASAISNKMLFPNYGAFAVLGCIGMHILCV
jgi:hypothetical protein